MKKKRIVVGNWKLGPETREEAVRIFAAVRRAAAPLARTEVALCPPFVFLDAVRNKAGKNVSLGAQDAFFEERGAFTGEISPVMLASVGARFVLAGHSERRSRGDTDEVVARKVAAIAARDLSPILCIGEKIRDQGGAYLAELSRELTDSLARLSARGRKKLLIAYEPVFAIGKNWSDAMRPHEIHETALFIKKILSDLYGKEEAFRIPILYGGSVNFENAQDIIGSGGVDGLLVGRESLAPDNFTALLAAVDAVRV